MACAHACVPTNMCQYVIEHTKKGLSKEATLSCQSSLSFSAMSAVKKKRKKKTIHRKTPSNTEDMAALQVCLALYDVKRQTFILTTVLFARNNSFVPPASL